MKSTPPPAGYSGRPLAQKLGIKAGHVVALIDAPPGYLELLGELPPDVTLREGGRGRADLVQCFTKSRAALAKSLPALGRAIFPDGALWISWPKKSAVKSAPKSAGLASDVTEDVIRELCLPLQLVDVKVCAVDATWSGLKLVWRKERRSRAVLVRRTEPAP